MIGVMKWFVQRDPVTAIVAAALCSAATPLLIYDALGQELRCEWQCRRATGIWIGYRQPGPGIL
jgi:hypothetical protein